MAVKHTSLVATILLIACFLTVDPATATCPIPSETTVDFDHIQSTLNPGDGDVSLSVFNYSIICLAPYREKGFYTSATLVIEYKLATSSGPSQFVYFDFACRQATWIPFSITSRNGIDDVANDTRTNCSYCSGVAIGDDPPGDQLHHCTRKLRSMYNVLSWSDTRYNL